MQNEVDLKEAYSRSAVTVSMVIPAGVDTGGGVIEPGYNSQSLYGKSFYLRNANGEIEIKTNQTAFKQYKQAQGEEFPEELRFNRLEFRNYNTFDVTIKIWCGFGKYIDQRQEVIEGYTQIFGYDSATNIIATGTQVDFDGAPNGDKLQRKALVVSNRDANGELIILDATGVFCCAVFPSTSVILPISSACSVRNESGADISCYISEVWYVVAPF